MISLNLALLNLMPVPVLDGGQIAILALEGIARRDLSIRVKERIAMAGAALILLLMVTVLYNDIARISDSGFSSHGRHGRSGEVIVRKPVSNASGRFRKPRDPVSDSFPSLSPRTSAVSPRFLRASVST